MSGRYPPPFRRKALMMQVLIVGASKGIGLETTRQALEAGHHVRALARSAVGMALSDPNLAELWKRVGTI